MEKMQHLIHAGQLVFAFAFIVSAWREYNDEGTWRVFNLNGGVAAEEYTIGCGIVMKANYIIGLGIVMKLLGGILFIFSTYLGALFLLIYQAILSPLLYDIYNRDFIRFRQSYQHFLQTTKSVCDRDRVYKKFREKFFNHINETVSANDGSYEHKSMVNELLLRPEICDQIDKIERQVISNPLFTENKFKESFMPFIKGVGIVAVLVFFIVMKHKYGMLKKHKTN